VKTLQHGHALIASDARELVRSLPVEKDAIRTRAVLKAAGARLVRISLDAGQTLTAHTAATPLLIQTLQGEAVVIADGERIAVCEGGVLHLDAGVEHAVEAIAPTHLLVTFLDAAGRDSVHEHRDAGAVQSDPGESAADSAAAAEAPATTTATSATTDTDLHPVDTLFDRVARGSEPPLPQEALTLVATADDTACACGEADLPDLPELDVRTVPHAIRHGTVFGALDAVRPGSGLVLVAHHDPLPLLAQIRQRTGERFAVRYLQRGPDAWRIQFVDQGASHVTAPRATAPRS